MINNPAVKRNCSDMFYCRRSSPRNYACQSSPLSFFRSPNKSQNYRVHLCLIKSSRWRFPSPTPRKLSSRPFDTSGKMSIGAVCRPLYLPWNAGKSKPQRLGIRQLRCFGDQHTGHTSNFLMRCLRRVTFYSLVRMRMTRKLVRLIWRVSPFGFVPRFRGWPR